jgi:signal transduction histidine kinase
MALIDDILDYSKIDSGKLTLEKSLLDLVSVILFKIVRRGGCRLY